MFLGYIRALQDVEPGKLSYLYVSLSNLCNAKCLYCDVHDSPADRLPWTRERLHTVFSEAVKMGCQTIHFLGGGEPLVAPTIKLALSVCAELDLRVVITTNGSHLKKRFEHGLMDVDLEAVLVSLDSHLPQQHDQIRRFRGLWQRAVLGMEAVKQANPQTAIILNHVLTAENAPHLPTFIEFAAEYNAQAINLIPVKDCEALETNVAQRSSFMSLLSQHRQYARTFGIELLYNQEDADEWHNQALGQASQKTYRCVFPEHALYLDCPTGDVFPCDCTVHREPHSTFVLGNIFEQTLEEIWSASPISKLRQQLRSPCDPGCKRDCDWNNMRTNEFLLNVHMEEATSYANHG